MWLHFLEFNVWKVSAHFMVRHTEAWTSNVSCSGPMSLEGAELGFQPRLVHFPSWACRQTYSLSCDERNSLEGLPPGSPGSRRCASFCNSRPWFRDGHIFEYVAKESTISNIFEWVILVICIRTQVNLIL